MAEGRAFALCAVLAALTTCAVVGLSGCAAASEQRSGSEPALASIPVVTARSQLVASPLLAYKLSVEDQLAIQRAVPTLVAQCMARFGVNLVRTETARDDVAAVQATRGNRYGPITADEARAAVPREGARPEPQKAGARQVQDPRQPELQTGQTADGSPSKLRDRDGKPVPQYGCGREAFDKLGYRPDDVTVVDDLLAQASQQLSQDSRFRAVDAQWSSCMKERGFDLPGRNAERGEQLQAALQTDIDCAHKVNWIGVANAVDVAYQKQIIAEKGTTLTAVHENDQAMVAKAQAVLRGG